MMSRVVNVMLLLCLAILIILIVITPKPKEKFSTFYVTNETGSFSFPKELPFNYTIPLVLGVENNEFEDTNYTITLLTKDYGPIVIKEITVENNKSLEFNFSRGIDWLGRGFFNFSLYKNKEPTDLSLILWVNGSPFFVLNETGGLQLRKVIPMFRELPVLLFVMNEFNESRIFDLSYKYYFYGANVSEVQPVVVQTVNLSKEEITYVPVAIWVNKYWINPVEFMMHSDGYNKTYLIDIEGDTFYLLNESGGYDIPSSLPAGSELKVIVGISYAFYMPEYRPLDFFLNQKYVPEGLTEMNATLLNRYIFILNYGQTREIEMSQTINPGNNTFIYDVSASTFSDRIELNVLGT